MTDYLAALDRAADADKYPLVKQWIAAEPLPFFAQLRAQRPILATPECVLVARHADITDLLSMPKIFTVNLYKAKMGVTDTSEGYLMAHDDDALHYREKSLMQGMLSREDLPRVRKLVADTSRQILDDAGGELEVVNRYCRQVPAVLVRDYFGLDGVEIEQLLRWSLWNQYDAFHNQPFDLNSAALADKICAEHDKVSAELEEYILLLIARKEGLIRLEALKGKFLGIAYFARLAIDTLRGRRQRGSGDDVVMRLLKSSFDDDIGFGIARQGINIGGLLIGAIETTSQAVAQTLQFFLDDPVLLRRARNAAIMDDPILFDAMVWEALRFVPIAPYVFRQAAIDCEVALGSEHQTTIPAGANVLLLTQSAMFDERIHRDPETFNPNRNWYHHFNFGFGSHQCLGKYVGMVMIPEMVRHVLLRNNIRAEQPIDYRDGPFPEHYVLNWR